MTLEDLLVSFGEESLRLLRTQNFLLNSSLTALSDDSDFRQSYKRLEDIVTPFYKSSFEYISSRLFIGYLSSFELFLQDVLTLILKKYPKKIGSVEFSLSDVLDAPDKDVLIQRAIEQRMNNLFYKKPNEYLSDYCDFLSISKEPLLPHWPVFVEAKARRDLGVHANWKCNSTYIRKLQEAGISSAFKPGQITVPGTDGYFDQVENALLALAELIVRQTQKKHDL